MKIKIIHSYWTPEMSEPSTPNSSAQYFRQKLKNGENVMPPTPEDVTMKENTFEKQFPLDLQSYSFEEEDSGEEEKEDESKRTQMYELLQTPLVGIDSPSPFAETPLVAKEYFGYTFGGKERLEEEKESDEKRHLNSLMQNLEPKSFEKFELTSKSISYLSSKLVNDVVNKTVAKLSTREDYKSISKSMVNQALENSIQKNSKENNIEILLSKLFNKDSETLTLLLNSSVQELQDAIKILNQVLSSKMEQQENEQEMNHRVANKMIDKLFSQVVKIK
jgi:hypothetical protein